MSSVNGAERLYVDGTVTMCRPSAPGPGFVYQSSLNYNDSKRYVLLMQLIQLVNRNNSQADLIPKAYCRICTFINAQCELSVHMNKIEVFQ